MRPCIPPAPRSRLARQPPTPVNPAPICEDMSEAPTVFQRRIVIGAVFCVAAFALVGIRLVHVTLMKPFGDGRPETQTVARADLVDRNGELLARDLPVKDIYARPLVFWDKPQAAHDLAAATGGDQ